MQVNVRLELQLVRQLEARARANCVSFSAEMRQRLINSLNTDGNQSLADFLADFRRRLRDIIERDPRKGDDIERIWRRLNAQDAKVARLGMYMGGEEENREIIADCSVASIPELNEGAETPRVPRE